MDLIMFSFVKGGSNWSTGAGAGVEAVDGLMFRSYVCLVI